MKFWFLALGLTLGCTSDGTGIIKSNSPDDLEGGDDTEGPAITHTPVDGSQPYGEDVFISCSATDAESGVFIVSVYYKQETSNEWEDAQLRLVDAAGTYEGYIPGDDVGSGGMDYYLSAIDGADNESFMPDDGEEDAYHFRVSSN